MVAAPYVKGVMLRLGMVTPRRQRFTWRSTLIWRRGPGNGYKVQGSTRSSLYRCETAHMGGSACPTLAQAGQIGNPMAMVAHGVAQRTHISAGNGGGVGRQRKLKDERVFECRSKTGAV